MKKKFVLAILATLATLVLLSTTAVLAFKYSFSDVHEKDWFYQPIMKIADKKIMTGYEDNTFRPYNNINRAELAEVLSSMDDNITVEVNSLNDQIDELHARLKLLEDKLKETNTTKTEVIPEIKTENTVAPVKETEKTSSSFEDSWNNPKVIEEKTTKETIITESKIEPLIKQIEIDLNQEKELMNGYSLFTESRYKQFKLQYPKNYFWNNAIGTKKKDLGYLWYIAFGSKDFSEMEETDYDNNTDMSISIVKNNKIVSTSEIQIYVKIDKNEYFLLEGKKAYATQLELMAGSLQKINE